MSNCINNRCQLCKNLVISVSVTVVAVDGVDTLVIDIPAGSYSDGQKVCLVIAQAIPDTATINQPVAISIGGDTTTVYPLINCDCTPVTASALRVRKRYPFRVNTTPTSAVFKSLSKLPCIPTNNLQAIPFTAGTVTPAEASLLSEARSVTRTVTTKTTLKAD